MLEYERLEMGYCMGFLDGNLNEILSYVKEAYTKVYGIQYKKLITDRIDSGVYICYDKDSDSDFYDKCLKSGFKLDHEYTRLYLDAVKDDGNLFVMHARGKDGKPIGVMFLPISKELDGQVEFAFLHECGHIIDISNFEANGFDLYGDFHYANPSDYREYERFNEALTDIFALEVIDVLHDANIYFAEGKNDLVSNTEEINTTFQMKEIVRVLLDNYRDEIIYSKLTGDYSVLFNKVGKDNFEKFNNIINQVQCLIDGGLFIDSV